MILLRNRLFTTSVDVFVVSGQSCVVDACPLYAAPASAALAMRRSALGNFDTACGAGVVNGFDGLGWGLAR